MNSILYTSYDGLCDPLGKSQILPYLNGLAAKGYSIHIISFEKEINIKATVNVHNNIRWHPLPYHKSPPIIGTIYDIIKSSMLANNLVKSQHIALIHCRSYIPSIIGLQLKHKFGIKFIFDMRGFWADERLEGGIWNINNPIFKLIYTYFKKKERRFIQEANHIISLTENAKEEIIQDKKLSGCRKNIDQAITVIPTCVDIEHFNPSKINQAEKDELKNQLGIRKEDYILLYLGSIGTWYMLEEMLQYFLLLKTKKQESRFLFVTTEPSSSIENSLKTICNKEGVTYNKRDLIITKAERKLVPLHISICNSSVFFIRTTYSKKASSATKMGELLAMGKPIITNNGWGDIEKLVINSIGIIINDFSSNSYLEAINTLLELNYEPEDIRDFARGYFDLEAGIKKYDNIYQKLILDE